MAVFKFENCPACGYKRKEPNPVRNPQNPCPKCHTIMRYSKNWSISYQVAGKKKIKSIGPQKRMAEAALGKIKTEIQENKHFDKSPSTPWNKAVEMIGASRAGIFIHLMPVFGVIMAYIFLGERLRSYHIAGICLIFLGIYLTTIHKMRPL